MDNIPPKVPPIEYDLASMTEAELSFVLSGLGQPRYRAKQLYEGLLSGKSLCDISNLPRELRRQLGENYPERGVRVEQKQCSAMDGTVKYLFRLSDGETVESVFMRYKHGNTLCISSQVGCRMGCRFCASTIDGKVRDLFPSEMTGQILAASHDTGERVSNVVIMGIGEPLDNYDNVIRFLHLVNEEKGLNIGLRHISLSTCGIVPNILRLAEEDLPVTLSVSLHASNNQMRSSLMPINRKYPLEALLPACLTYSQKTGRRVSFEYTLICGENDDAETAHELSRLLNSYFREAGEPVHVNLILVNPVKERAFRKPDAAGAETFRMTLEKDGINATIRRRLGTDIDAACGQLRRKHISKGEDQ